MKRQKRLFITLFALAGVLLIPSLIYALGCWGLYIHPESTCQQTCPQSGYYHCEPGYPNICECVSGKTYAECSGFIHYGLICLYQGYHNDANNPDCSDVTLITDPNANPTSVFTAWCDAS